MPFSFVQLAGRFKAIIKTMSLARRIALGLLLIGTTAALVALVNWSRQPEFVPLYTHMSTEDAAEVALELRDRNIAYYLSRDGTVLLVPGERRDELRLDLAAQGLPRRNVDPNGTLPGDRDRAPTAARISPDQLEFQQRKEDWLEKRVLSMLEKVLGPGKAIVRVACDLDFVQAETTAETYLPENQVLRSERTSKETGVRKQDTTRDYEIGKTVSRQIMPVGIVKRLSAAVIVDGSYVNAGAAEGEKRTAASTYVPRTPEEMAKLENIVKRALNFDPARGDMVEVANIAFNSVPPGGRAPTDGVFDTLDAHRGLIRYGVVGLFVMLVFVFVIRPLTRWLTDTPRQDVELLQELPRAIAQIEKQYSQKEQYVQMVRQASQLAANKKEDAARLLEQWVKEA